MAVLAALLLNGCATVGPDYRAPDARRAGQPEQWSASLPAGKSNLEVYRWWTQFNSPVMTELIDVALANSPTVDAAVARILQSRATMGVDNALAQPSANGKVGVARAQNLDKRTANDAQSYSMYDADERGFSTTNSLQVDMRWELDLFGGFRRRREQSNAVLAVRNAEWRGARVSLAAAVSNTYTSRRHCDALLDVAQTDLLSRKQTHHLTEQRRDVGFAMPADADRTGAAVAEAQSNATGVRADCVTLQNRLVALTGLSYAQLGQRLETTGSDIPTAPSGKLELVSAQVIAQRPDITAAERRLAAANASIGVAEAAYLPSVTLMGSIGINVGTGSGNNIGDYTQESRPWSFGPSVSLPLFDGGKGAADAASAKAVFREAYANYQDTVRNAVQEVENALVRVDVTRLRLNEMDQASRGYARYFEAVQAQYLEGAASLLLLEDARRIFLTSRQSWLAEQLAHTQAWVSLFKALGGGGAAEDAPLFNPVTTADVSQSENK